MSRAIGRSSWRPGLALASAAVIAACGGGALPSDDTAAANGAKAPPAAGDTGSASLDPASFTAAMVALGDSIFHGRAASGICYTCHGPDAKGGALAPDLTDGQWLHGDGAPQFIARMIREGVPQPKQFPAPMPAFGTTFNPQQVAALTAYVYSRSHPEVGR